MGTSLFTKDYSVAFGTKNFSSYCFIVFNKSS